ncbi:12793_t:CDS:2 [Entrophospora sp. SA101]|nr:12793_t:CDS:2 [Entrophospora sp. SA101]CAJ0902118.1 13395_t:CDS:2 [Entrophospora sp. SA101]
MHYEPAARETEVYYTSSGGADLEVEKAQLQPFIEQICGEGTPIQIIQPTDRKSKGYDCGIYLVKYIEEILESGALELKRQYTAEECQEFRETMVKQPEARSGRNLGSGGSSSVGAISYNAQAVKNAFFSKTSARQAQRISGDGAGHNLDEDIQKLVGTFNKVADMSNAIQALKDCSSSEQFLAHKNALLAKCNQAIAEMNIGAIESNVGYRSVELEKLQLDEQKIKGEIGEAYRQAEEAKRKGDTTKVTELYQAIKNLKAKHDEIVKQIIANP